MSEYHTSMEELIALGDIASIARGTINPSLWSGERFIYYSIPGYDATGGPLETLGKEIQSNKTLLESDCVLISKLNPRIPRVCHAKIPEIYRTICSTEFIPLVPRHESVAIEYLTHYLRSPVFQERFQAAAGGSTNSHSRVTPGEILDWEVFIPPLPEQKKIAKILSGMDNLIEQVKREATKYEALKQATLYEYPLKYSSGQVLLRECASLQAGGTPDREKSSFWNGNIPWVKTGEINYNLITSTEECISEEGLQYSSARLLPAGSVLMAMYGQGVTRGRVARLGISAATNQACVAINSRTSEAGNDYLYWILTSKYEHLRSQAQEGTQKNLSKGIVGDQIIPLLENGRQEEFCRLCSNLDNLGKLKRRESSALSNLKNSLSADLLSGRKRVGV